LLAGFLPVWYYTNLKPHSMKATIAKKTEQLRDYLVKLRIDSRTVILVRTRESLKMWKSKYPKAVEIL
jgi:hypothetical protein